MTIIKICEGCGLTFEAKSNSVKYCSKRCSKMVERNAAWKGDGVSLKALHKWVEKRLSRPVNCGKCGEEGKVDLANISGEYKRDLDDWKWLCRKCHMEEDGRLEIFLSHSQNRKVPTQTCLQCNKEFEPHSNRRKFCSKSCSCTYTNLNNRDSRDYDKRKAKLPQVLINEL